MRVVSDKLPPFRRLRRHLPQGEGPLIPPPHEPGSLTPNAPEVRGPKASACAPSSAQDFGRIGWSGGGIRGPFPPGKVPGAECVSRGGGRKGVSLSLPTAILLLLLPAAAAAHGFRAGTARLEVSGATIEAALTLPHADLAALFPKAGPREFSKYLDSRFFISVGDEECSRRGELKLESAGDGLDSRVLFGAHYECPEPPEELKVVNRLLFERPGGYRHTVVVAAGGREQQQLYNPSAYAHIFAVHQVVEEGGGVGALALGLSLLALLLLGGLFLWLKRKADSVQFR